jgi:hypothetical protein
MRRVLNTDLVGEKVRVKEGPAHLRDEPGFEMPCWPEEAWGQQARIRSVYHDGSRLMYSLQLEGGLLFNTTEEYFRVIEGEKDELL